MADQRRTSLSLPPFVGEDLQEILRSLLDPPIEDLFPERKSGPGDEVDNGYSTNGRGSSGGGISPPEKSHTAMFGRSSPRSNVYGLGDFSTAKL